MRRLLLAAAPVCLLALAGCATVYTPGTQGLPPASLAQLDANSRVYGRNYSGYAVTSIQIDGKGYPLREDRTTFVLAPGSHSVAFTYSELPPMSRPARIAHFEALAGGKYQLWSSYSSAGLGHQIQTPDHKNVLQWDANDLR